MKKLILIMSLMTPQVLMATVAPKLYTNCEAKKYIKHPAIPSGIYFSGDCKVAYVLPPKFSNLKMDSINNYPKQDCDIYKARTGVYKKRVEERTKEANVLQSKLMTPSAAEVKECEASGKKVGAKQARVDTLNVKRNTLLQSKEAKTSELNVCQAIKCQTLKSQIRTITAELVLLDQELATLERAVAKLPVAEVCKPKTLTDSEIMGIEELIRAKEDEVLTESENYFTAVAKYSDTQGAAFNFKLEGRLQDQVVEYERLNRNLGISFAAMQVEPTLHFNVKVAPNPQEDDRKLVPFYGIHALEIMSALMDDKDPTKPARFGSSLSGMLSLNIPATCEAINEGSKLNPALFVIANVGYKYNLMLEKSIEAEINMSYFYEIITQSKKSGGFFKKKSSTAIRETIRNQKSMKIKIENEHPNDKWSEDDWALAELVFNRMMQEALDTVGAKYEMPAGNSGPNGAEALSKGLNKCPYVYCYAAKVVLDVANAIFGSTTVSQNYTKNVSDIRYLSATTNKPFEFWDTYTFEVK